MLKMRIICAVALVSWVWGHQLQAAEDWPPSVVESNGRQVEVFRHGIRKQWGYQKSQNDTAIVVYPKIERKNAPLYVVLHSAGHNVYSAVKCTNQVGNHDIYRSPDNFYALYLDCRSSKIDWWWGGRNPYPDALDQEKKGGALSPAEKRVIDTVKWAIEKYGIDPNRVYLCGNSMGGSGTLGIGVRHGDIFAAIKANVPAGIEHVSDRMYLTSKSVPEGVKLPDPPVVIDYSGSNDQWSKGHEQFVQAMNDRKYPLYFYWGPFGHGNNSAAIMQHNDLVHSFDWLNVKKDEPYAVFSNASCNSKLPQFGTRTVKATGQVNAFFRWKNIADTSKMFKMSLYLLSAKDLKTKFKIPKYATVDVSLRRIQNMQVKPGQRFNWSFGADKGTVTADQEGVITIARLNIKDTPTTLTMLLYK